MVLLLATVGELRAAQPVVRLFTTEDGLVRNWVARIRRDRAGRLWFCTVEGLSLFDGEKFTNYTVAGGLPYRAVSDFLDAGESGYWIVTPAGVFRFQPRGAGTRLSFTQVPLEGAHYPMRYPTQGDASLLLSRTGEIWVGTGIGLYRIETRGGAARGVRVSITQEPHDVRAMLEDRAGNLWVIAGWRLVRRRLDGSVSSWETEIGIPLFARALMEDRAGRLWVGGAARDRGCGLSVLDISGARPSMVACATAPAKDVQSLYEDRGGDVWVGGFGLARLPLGQPATGQWIGFGRSSVFDSQYVANIVDDTQGHLWLAVGNVGVARLTRHGFSTFTEADGLESRNVVGVFESQAGKLYAVTGAGHTLNEFDGQRFTPIAPRLPAGVGATWGESSVILQDRRNEWWMATSAGVARFSRVRAAAELAHTAPRAIYGVADLVSMSQVLRVYEDIEGGIWATGLGVVRWDPLDQRFRDLTPGLQSLVGQTPFLLAFAADRSGAIWIGLDSGGLVRYRGGRFESIREGVPAGAVDGLAVDRYGRIWIASTMQGLGRIDNPAAAVPAVRRYGTQEGLASDHLFAITADQAGGIYVAGGQGVDRLNPETGAVQHYLTSDGLPPGETQRLYCDRTGALWFASNAGLSRYEPETEQPQLPSSPSIHSVRVSGVAAIESDQGENSVGGIDLPAGHDDIEIAYGSVDFSVSHSPRYQYRLLPVDRDWRSPTALRSVRYARLGPARYTFQVRKIDASGAADTNVASVAFRILPPLWQRWWFLLSSAASLVALGYGAFVYRWRHVVAVQQVRTRLASDLHDDLGSGLVEIAILAEVAKQSSGADETGVMETIAERARELRAAMGDIVWSVDPQGDTLTHVIRRWRQAAAGLLGGISLAFTAPPESETDCIAVSPGRRRHLLLLFKEAIANVARHARATHVLVEVAFAGSDLRVRIEDDGCGFRPAEGRLGNGLRTLAHRAGELKGELRIDSAPDSGTTLDLRLPLR